MSSLPERVVHLAADRLPPDAREVRREEWLAELPLVGGRLGGLLWATGLLLGARRMSRGARQRRNAAVASLIVTTVWSVRRKIAWGLVRSAILYAIFYFIGEATVSVASGTAVLAGSAIAATARVVFVAWRQRRKSRSA